MNSNVVNLYIIGYPKSGNTWMARLISDCLDAEMIGGDNPIDNADREIVRNSRYKVCKSHYSKNSKPKYLDENSKIIYMVRDFRDVLVSGFFHLNKFHDDNKYVIDNPLNCKWHWLYRLKFNYVTRTMLNKWRGTIYVMFVQKILSLKNILQGKKNESSLAIGNWSEHVKYWAAFPGVIVIKYEDLNEDTYHTITKAFYSLGIKYSTSQVKEAIERQSFTTRKKEFKGMGDRLNTAFMRKGKVGDWKRFLDKKLINRIREAHGDVMQRFGYKI